MWRRIRDKSKKASDFGSGLIGAMAAAPEADAADTMRKQGDLIRSTAAKYAGMKIGQRKGFLFEAIEVAKANTDAARQGISNRLKLTSSGDTADAIEYKHRKVKAKVQFKAHRQSNDAKRALDDPKYRGMKKVTIKDHDGKIAGAKGQTRMAGNRASSGGTSHKELASATKHPKNYANRLMAKQISRESAVAGANAAAAGAVIGGAQSAIRNLYAYSKGHKDGKQVAADIARDSAKSGTRSGLAGWFGSVLRHVGKRVGSNALAKSNVATAVASGVIDAGVVVYEFARGEITAEEAAERLGDTGCSTLSGIYLGAAGGAVFGPVGAIVGSVVGYILAASVYQSSVAILKEAKLAEEEADRVVALCEAAARAMDEQRRQFEAKLATSLNAHQVSFDRHFKQIDDALFADDHRKAIKGLSGLARSFGKELRLGEFKDFREFMVESDEPLRL